MMVSRVAYRYAGAALDAIPEGLDAEALLSDFADLRSTIQDSRELLLFFQSPIISYAMKKSAVEALFRSRMHDYVLVVINLLLEKRRESLILEIVEGMFELQRKRLGIRVSEISSGIELDADQKKSLQSVLEQATGSKIEAEYNIRPEIKGGVVVRIGDTVYNGSLEHQLRELRKRFVSGA